MQWLALDVKELNNKVAIITGAGEGLGRCLSLKLSDCGAKVILIGHNESKIVRLANEIGEKGGAAAPLVCDIRNPVSVADARAVVDRQLAI